MKIISWNVNGIRAAEKKGLFDFLAKQKPEILCLQETKIDSSLEDKLEFLPRGYTTFFSSAVKKGYSGVSTLILDKILSNLKTNSFALGEKQFDTEGRYLVSEFKDFILYNVYFPSGTTGDLRQKFKYQFLDHFLEHVKSLEDSKRKKLIVCGDFNICHREIDIHHPQTATKNQLSGFLPEERAWFSRFLDSGFNDVFRDLHREKKDCYTWWSYRAGSRGKNLGWRIDYFLVASKFADRIKSAKIFPDVAGSDHCPISIKIE